MKKGIDKSGYLCYNIRVAGMAQSVEHVIGNDEVISSILITSSKDPCTIVWGSFVFISERSLLYIFDKNTIKVCRYFFVAKEVALCYNL